MVQSKAWFRLQLAYHALSRYIHDEPTYKRYEQINRPTTHTINIHTVAKTIIWTKQ
jgi:hypothetical protein